MNDLNTKLHGMRKELKQASHREEDKVLDQRKALEDESLFPSDTLPYVVCTCVRPQFFVHTLCDGPLSMGDIEVFISE